MLDQATVKIGQMLGEYRVTGPLGEGGMGEVYEGVQPVIGKRVAIKLLKDDLASNPAEAARLLAEARCVNTITHRGIVDIFSFGATDAGRQYFVMEYLDGCSVTEALKKAGRFELGQSLQLLDELLSVVASAHDAGVLHRDLKPSNLFLVSQADGTAFLKVLDFGLAKASPEVRAGMAETHESKVMGTPEYMAPEQALGRDVGPAADLYAVGIIAFELLVGRRPFLARNFIELINMHINLDVPAPSTLQPGVPPQLDEWVLSLLAKKPDQRPASAHAARQTLRRLRQQLGWETVVLRAPVPPSALASAGASRRAVRALAEPSNGSLVVPLSPSMPPGAEAARTGATTSMRAPRAAEEASPTQILEAAPPTSALAKPRRTRVVVGLIVGGAALVVGAGWALSSGTSTATPQSERANRVAAEPAVTPAPKPSPPASSPGTHGASPKSAGADPNPTVALAPEPPASSPGTQGASPKSAGADPNPTVAPAAEPPASSPATHGASPKSADADPSPIPAKEKPAASGPKPTVSPPPAKAKPTRADAKSKEVATKERAALKPDAVAARFARVQRAWQAVRSSNDAAAQRIGNGWLETIRKNVSAGALTEATEGMNLFVQDKLGGHEP